MSDTTSNCAWVCSRCGAFVFSGTGHLCPSQRASTELMSDVQKEILDNLRTIRDQTRQIAELEAERDRLLKVMRIEAVNASQFSQKNFITVAHSDVIEGIGNRLRDAALAASEPKEPRNG